MLVMRGLLHAYPPLGRLLRNRLSVSGSGPLVKTAVDQTLKRSITTKLLTTQPPPLLTINGVVGSGSLLQREPLQSIRQAGNKRISFGF